MSHASLPRGLVAAAFVAAVACADAPVAPMGGAARVAAENGPDASNPPAAAVPAADVPAADVPDAGPKPAAAEPLVVSGAALPGVRGPGDDAPEAALPAPDEPAAPPAPDEAASPALGVPHPLVFVHGFSGFAEIGPVDYFFRVLDDLRARGHEVSAPALPPIADSDVRADALAAHIDAVLRMTGRTRVHLIAHSQGGVDARRLLARSDAYRSRVASLTTIATPHRGTPLADDAQLLPEGVLSPSGRLWAWLLGVADTSDEVRTDSDAGPALAEGALADVVSQLSATGMARFNEDNPDPTDVPLFSIAGYSNLQAAPALCQPGLLFAPTDAVDAMDPLLLSTGLLLAGANPFAPRANDGVVPTDSMPWGTFLGCVPADHLDQIGQVADFMPQLVSGFDHLEMYRTLVDFLRRSEGPAQP